MKLKRPSALTVVTAALLVLLPTLAVLQYRWVGQISDAARDRMERNLRVATFQFSEAFDDEIVRAVNGLRANTATVSDRAWGRYADRHSTWAATAEHPELVAQIFLIAAEGDELGVSRWVSTSESFEPAWWDGALAAWRQPLEAAWTAFRNGDPLPRTALPGDDTFLVAPLVPNRGPAPAAPEDPVFGFTVLQLDANYIRTRMLPDLTDRHFSNSEGDRYRVAVVDASEMTSVVYRSDPEAPLDIEGAAEVESIHGSFRDPFGFLRGGNGGRGGPIPGRGDPRADGRRNVFRGGGPGGPGGPRFNDDFGRWVLLVQHESGSLDAAVAAVRWRNLGVSFGVLLLLTGSVALISISSRRAQQLAKQQMEFVAGVSHELRTPVAVIRSAAENLSHGVVGSGDRVKRYGQMIEGEARRLGEMVERVLQYAGIASGLGVGTKLPLAPTTIVDAALADCGPLLGQVTVQKNVAAGLPLILGDEAALRSAVQNLLGNAVKYGGRDGWVGVTVEPFGAGRRSEVRITVADHGDGIPNDELPHIFEPFFRGAIANAQQIHGNGLGLALVQQIVAAHGGRVTVTTRQGEGTAFTIHLPAIEPDARAEAISPETGPARSTPDAVHS